MRLPVWRELIAGEQGAEDGDRHRALLQDGVVVLAIGHLS
jgi:hypothetical protein